MNKIELPEKLQAFLAFYEIDYSLKRIPVHFDIDDHKEEYWLIDLICMDGIRFERIRGLSPQEAWDRFRNSHTTLKGHAIGEGDVLNRTALKSEEAVKPPLGIVPRRIFDRDRLTDLIKVVDRYNEAQKDIPLEWVMEMMEIINRLNESDD